MENSAFHSQRKWNIGFVVFLTLLLALLSQINIRLTIILILGISLGFVLQKSRFVLCLLYVIQY